MTAITLSCGISAGIKNFGDLNIVPDAAVFSAAGDEP